MSIKRRALWLFYIWSLLYWTYVRISQTICSCTLYFDVRQISPLWIIRDQIIDRAIFRIRHFYMRFYWFWLLQGFFCYWGPSITTIVEIEKCWWNISSRFWLLLEKLFVLVRPSSCGSVVRRQSCFLSAVNFRSFKNCCCCCELLHGQGNFLLQGFEFIKFGDCCYQYFFSFALALYKIIFLVNYLALTTGKISAEFTKWMRVYLSWSFFIFFLASC
jgi:hypothetical protein